MIAFLWDIDGTLIDTTSLIVESLDHVYRRFMGRTLPPEEIRAIIGTPLSEQVRVLGDPAACGVDPSAMEEEFIRYYEANRNRERIVQPAIDALIQGRQAGHPTGLVTSKNEEELANTLPRLGIQPFLDAVVSADHVTRPKPDPEAVLLALRWLDRPPGQAIFIGDTVHDLRAGRAAGVRRCAVTWGAAPRDLLLAEQPELLCDDPTNLATVLGIP